MITYPPKGGFLSRHVRDFLLLIKMSPERKPEIDPKIAGHIAANLIKEMGILSNGNGPTGNPLLENPQIREIYQALEGVSEKQIREVLEALTKASNNQK